MNLYKKAAVVGLVMGPIAALVGIVLTLLGVPKETALAAAIGVVCASMVVVAMKRNRPEPE